VDRQCDFTVPIRLVGMDEDADICPVQDIDTARWLMRLAKRDWRGMPLVAGGSLDQPARLQDMIDETTEAMARGNQ